jgi:hypothetical protein
MPQALYFVRIQAVLVDEEYLAALVVDRPPGGAFKRITTTVRADPLSPYAGDQRTTCPTVLVVPDHPRCLATRGDLASVITFLDNAGYYTELGGPGDTVLMVIGQ